MSPGQRQPAAEPDHRHLPEGGQRDQRRVEPGGQPGRPHPLREQPPRGPLQCRDLAGLLPEALDHADPGDRLLHLLGDVRGPLLGRPGGREQRGPHLHRDHAGQRQHDQRDHGEQRRQPGHRGHRHDDQRHQAGGQRRHRQQRLHQLQVGDGPGDHLPGAQRVLALPVQPLHRGEQLAPQVVLDRERQPATEVPAQERRAEHQRGHHDHARHQQRQAGRRPGHRVVHGRPGQQRDQRLQGQPEHRDQQRPDGHPAVLQAGTDEAADPAWGSGVVTPPR